MVNSMRKLRLITSSAGRDPLTTGACNSMVLFITSNMTTFSRKISMAPLSR